MGIKIRTRIEMLVREIGRRIGLIDVLIRENFMVIEIDMFHHITHLSQSKKMYIPKPIGWKT